MIVVELPVRPPFDATTLLDFFARRAVPGVEEVDGPTYRRSLRLAGGAGVAAMTLGDDAVACALTLDDPADRDEAVRMCRHVLDLDMDPAVVDAAFGSDALLGRLVAARPGLRCPGNPHVDELLVRAMLGQQVSVAGARTIAGRLATELGEPLATPVGSVTHQFPSAAAFAARGPDGLPMPAARARALANACAQLADGSLLLDPTDPADAVRRLVALPGIGPWTAGYVAMRALGDHDVFLAGDLGVRHALTALGVDGAPAAAGRMSERWRPWRSYAVHHLWASLS